MTTTPGHDPVADLPHMPFLDGSHLDEIDAYLTDTEADDRHEMPPRSEPWRPDNDRAAEWAMAQCVAATAAIDAAEADAQEWRDRISETLRQRTRQHRRRLAFFSQVLEEYALAWHDRDPRANKTLSLPSGKVTTTTPQTPTVKIADPAVVRAWLETLAGVGDDRVTDEVLQRPEPQPMVSGVRKLVVAVEKDGGWLVVDKVTGEKVPGLVAELGGTTAVAKPG